MKEFGMNEYGIGDLDKTLERVPVKRLTPNIMGKLVEEKPQSHNLAAEQLAKAIAREEDAWFQKTTSLVIPDTMLKMARDRNDHGFSLRKLLNEYDLKISFIAPSKEQAEADQANGTVRRHAVVRQKVRSEKNEQEIIDMKIIGEMIWEWTPEKESE